MPQPTLRSLLAIFLSSCILAPGAFAFDTPLSDTAVREAYFIGQRHDESMMSYLGKYTKLLPAPKTGPYISSVQFLTPFAQLIQYSNTYVGNYSAQQAEIDHRGKAEIVRVTIEITFTESYPSMIPVATGSRRDSPTGFRMRPFDFWQDFQVAVTNGETVLEAAKYSGDPHYVCNREGACALTGAAIHLEFPAERFTEDSAKVTVYPPEGDEVSVTFDLASFR